MMRRVSKKRAAELRVRAEIVRRHVGPVPCARGCGRVAVDTHEPLTRARGGSITDEANMVPLCRTCHDEVPTASWAYDEGLLVHSWDRPPSVDVSQRDTLLDMALSEPMTFKTDPEQAEQIRALAARQSRTESNMIRVLIDAGLSAWNRSLPAVPPEDGPAATLTGRARGPVPKPSQRK